MFLNKICKKRKSKKQHNLTFINFEEKMKKIIKNQKAERTYKNTKAKYGLCKNQK